MRLEKIACIFHGGCVDGFTAAWCVHRALSQLYSVRFIAGEYQQPPPHVEPDELVLLVDFSYRKPEMLELAQRSLGVVIADHHATALDELKQDMAGGIFDFSAWDFRAAVEQIEQDMLEGRHAVYTYFDNERSGAGLAWDMLHISDFERSFMVSRVEDRDLWRFALNGSREVHAVLQSYEPSFDMWETLNATFQVEEARNVLLHEGAAIMRAHIRRLEELLPLVTRGMEFQTPFGSFSVPVANLPHIFASEGGHMLLDGRDLCGRSSDHPKHVGPAHHQFCATYYDAPLHRVFSLRSKPGGLDVGAIAAKYGGGGHMRSAGFKVPRGDDPADFEHIVYSTWELMQ